MKMTIDQLKNIDARLIDRDIVEGRGFLDMAEKTRVARYWNRYHPGLVLKKINFVFSKMPQDTNANLNEFFGMSTIGQLRVIGQMIEEKENGRALSLTETRAK